MSELKLEDIALEIRTISAMLFDEMDIGHPAFHALRELVRKIDRQVEEVNDYCGIEFLIDISQK